ncbi:MAG: hypothetical protein K5745_07365 [Saccharofermentans sp.]|nr:hypothetical protein [Saccharofermentans sp.]
MKKVFKLIALAMIPAVLCVAMSGCFDKRSKQTEDESEPVRQEEEEMVGAWDRDVTNEDIEKAKQALTDAASKLDGFGYEYTELLGTQLVAGTNYAICCTSTVRATNSDPDKVICYFYVDLEGNSEYCGCHFLDDDELADLDSVELDMSAAN